MDASLNYEQALMGTVFLNAGSGATTGNFKALLVIEEASLTNIDFNGPDSAQSPVSASKTVTYTGESVLEAATLAAGLYIPVPFTAITVASGTVMALGAPD